MCKVADTTLYFYTHQVHILHCIDYKLLRGSGSINQIIILKKNVMQNNKLNERGALLLQLNNRYLCKWRVAKSVLFEYRFQALVCSNLEVPKYFRINHGGQRAF